MSAEPAPAVQSTPEDVVADLVELVRARAANDDFVLDMPGSGKTRAALLRVLAELEPREDELAAWANGVDVLGTAYEQLLTGAERREAGQFQTPFWAADLMAAWLLREPTRLLLDPGAGRLLFRAGAHKKPPEQLLGLDMDPVACAMARMNLLLRGMDDCAELREADFLLDELADQPDAVTCNPPYSRHHAIPAAAKEAIHEGFERRLGVKFSRLAALHALFLVRAVEVSAPGARIAFITPGDWLDTNYGRAIKQWVLAHARVEGVVLFPEDALPFGGSVMSSAAITLLRKNGSPDADAPPAAAKTRVVRLPHEPPPVKAVLAAVAGSGTTSLVVEEVELTATTKWSRPSAARRRGTPLSELARVRRGIATGNNSFFVLSEAGRREWRIPYSDLRACITTPRLVEGLELTDLAEFADDAPRWVLACWRPEAEAEDSPLGDYLRHGRELGVHQTYLASRREPWYGLDRREPPAILWPYFNRGRLRFIRNRAGALPLNNWLGIEPHEDVDADQLWALLNEPATLKAFMADRRSYAGLTKLEPAELGAVRIRWQRSQMQLAV